MNPTGRHRVDVCSVGNHMKWLIDSVSCEISVKKSKTSHFLEACRTYVSSPLVVSLSLTRKVPRLFCRFRRSLSESRRVIFPKYHLPKWATENQCGAATERHQQTDTSSQMAGKTGFYWRALWKPSSHVYMQMYSR